MATIAYGGAVLLFCGGLVGLLFGEDNDRAAWVTVMAIAVQAGVAVGLWTTTRQYTSATERLANLTGAQSVLSEALVKATADLAEASTGQATSSATLAEIAKRQEDSAKALADASGKQAEHTNALVTATRDLATASGVQAGATVELTTATEQLATISKQTHVLIRASSGAWLRVVPGFAESGLLTLTVTNESAVAASNILGLSIRFGADGRPKEIRGGGEDAAPARGAVTLWLAHEMSAPWPSEVLSAIKGALVPLEGDDIFVVILTWRSANFPECRMYAIAENESHSSIDWTEGEFYAVLRAAGIHQVSDDDLRAQGVASPFWAHVLGRLAAPCHTDRRPVATGRRPGGGRGALEWTDRIHPRRAR